jgi:cell cycle sensor histidine kinase DivJ
MAVAAIVVAGAFCALAIREAKAEAKAETSSEGRREAALNRRVAEVAHELRTPLNHILGFADAIESQIFGEVGARNREYAGFIRESGARLLAMVNDMLDMTKVDSGDLGLEYESFDARELLDEAVREFGLSAQNKSITLELKTPDAPLMIRADRRAWRRIITNTLGNAVKFTPEGGAITLHARVQGERFTLDTSDTGPGIPASERASLGAPYVRGEGGLGVEGTGLGLSFVRALAHAHGGTLSFSEAPGGGALVRVEAPVAVKAP